MARKMRANMAHTLAIHRAVYPRGQSTFTAAWKRTAHTNQRVRQRENLWSRGADIYNQNTTITIKSTLDDVTHYRVTQNKFSR